MYELYGGGKKKEKTEASDEGSSSNHSSPMIGSSPPSKKRVSWSLDLQNNGSQVKQSPSLCQSSATFQGWKLALAHSPRRVSKLLARVQIVEFLLHLLKVLAQWQVLSKLSFHPCFYARKVVRALASRQCDQVRFPGPCHLWAEFVVGSHPGSKGFSFSCFPP